MNNVGNAVAQPVAWSDLEPAERSSLLARPALLGDEQRESQVRQIIEQVRSRGDAAVRELTKQLDGVDVETFELSRDEIHAAVRSLAKEDLDAIDNAIDNVRSFHAAQRPVDVQVETAPGVRCERLSHALDAVGLYVPSGSAPLPSTAIMLGVPASIAGCKQKILCTPPAADGSVNAATVAAAYRSGIERIFRIGGAQAIAAMAFGTESVPSVNKIFGPGNAWVTAAKSQVAQSASGPAIDMPAGPSEVLVIADDSADPEFVATDLLSQAEHGEDSQAVLLTTSFELATDVRGFLLEQLQSLPRRDIASVALSRSPLIVVESMAAAISISNQYAPEHLILQVRDARKHLQDVRNAGSVFLGPWSPESVGDYCSGTNHVLPTYGQARNISGLGVEKFMRSMTVQELTEEGLRKIGPTVERLAGLEGLEAHARAVRYRLRSDALQEEAG